MSRFVLVAIALGLLPAQDLKVQKRWNVVGVACSTSSVAAIDDALVRKTLEDSAKTLSRELPGIEWTISSEVRHATYEDDGEGRVLLQGRGMRKVVERVASDDDELARADIVFVFAAAPQAGYSGMACLAAHPRGKGRVWYSVVNTHQGERFAQRAREGLEKLVGRPTPRVGRVLEDASRVLDRPPFQTFALHATTVHEFGHFLVPGLADVRAAKNLHGNIGNGQDEPDQHDLTCIMWSPEPRSLLAKLRNFPRVLRYCDRCRERLGCE